MATNGKKKNDCCCGKTVTETNTKVTEYGTNGCHMPKGTLQYIGARYVPVFADPVEWSSDRPYEHLMMVQHEGNTYISKQHVPVGIPLPAPDRSNDYWVLMSDWNAQIAEYRAELERFVSETGARVDDLNDNVDALQLDVDAAEETIDTYVNDRDVMVVLGDSWSVRNDEGYPERCGSWTDVVQRALNVEVKNYAVRGCGFVRNYNSSTIAIQAQQAIEDATYNHKKVKYVVALGGRNDFNQGVADADIESAIQRLYQPLRDHFTNAHIRIFLGNANKTTIDDEAKRITTMCNHLACYPVTPIYWWVPMNMFYNENHANQRGYVALAERIIATLIGGKVRPLVKRFDIPLDDADFPLAVRERNWFEITIDDLGVHANGQIHFDGTGAQEFGAGYIELPAGTLSDFIPYTMPANFAGIAKARAGLPISVSLDVANDRLVINPRGNTTTGTGEIMCGSTFDYSIMIDFTPVRTNVGDSYATILPWGTDKA